MLQEKLTLVMLIIAVLVIAFLDKDKKKAFKEVFVVGLVYTAIILGIYFSFCVGRTIGEDSPREKKVIGSVSRY